MLHNLSILVTVLLVVVTGFYCVDALVRVVTLFSNNIGMGGCSVSCSVIASVYLKCCPVTLRTMNVHTLIVI